MQIERVIAGFLRRSSSSFEIFDDAVDGFGTVSATLAVEQELEMIITILLRLRVLILGQFAGDFM